MAAPPALAGTELSAAPAVEHLRLRLRPLQRALSEAVARRRTLNERLRNRDGKGLYVTEDQVAVLLDRVEQVLQGHRRSVRYRFLAEEADLESTMRGPGMALPLDSLEHTLGLDMLEIDAILLCAAVELDSAFEALFGYVLDDLTRRFPCPELVLELTAAPGDRAELLLRLGPLGRLRRRGLLAPVGEAPTGLRQELRLGPGVLDYLLTGRGDPRALFRDREEIEIGPAHWPPPNADPTALARVAAALAAGGVGVVGVWGPAGSGRDDAALAVAAVTGLPVRRLPVGDAACGSTCPYEAIRNAVRTCSVLGAVLWVNVDALRADGAAGAADVLAEELAVADVPVLLLATSPWLPPNVVAARAVAELELKPPDIEVRRLAWEAVLPGLAPDVASDLSARFRLSPAQLRAAARLAGTRAELAGDGWPEPVEDHLAAACAAITRRSSHRFATVVTPRRTAADLVLPSDLHGHVLEVARFYEAWPRVGEAWGFGHMANGGGIKALFTGDSGTGKTLAAEVIAGELGTVLIKVDLAQVVSKWVGETEKNLAAAFAEAEESHAVLFFDEADALFGRRGEVERGSDRYANLEVSYLLQRLEDFDGLAILASNLKDNIDRAFTRRLQIALHFPRPAAGERLRIWQLALPAAAPLEPDLDLEALAALDLTGGGIVSAARTAALLTADEGAAAIAMSHLVRGVTRQFRREARVLQPGDLGRHAALLPAG